MTPLVIAVTVDVTAVHLAEGRPGNCRSCALALAITDAVEGATGAYVRYTTTDLDPVPDARADVYLAGGGKLVLGLGPDVAGVMAAFDAHRDVAPFSFVAEVLDEFTEREVW